MLYRLYMPLILLLSSALEARLSTRLLYPHKMVINVAVADLRSAPEAVLDHVKLPTSDLTNPQQETQLLLGEQVLAQEQFTDTFGKKWLYVYTLQQDHFSFMLGWHKYRGWIQADQATPVSQFSTCNLVVKNLHAPLFDHHKNTILTVSIGTRFMGIKDSVTNLWQVTLPDGKTAWIHDNDLYHVTPTIQETETTLRSNIVAAALMFFGTFYSWGGRSAQSDEWQISSVDCSALINLAFLANGLAIPRMSNDQYLTAHKIKHGVDLKPGDLVLFDPVHKDRNPHHMTHVMMYIADDLLLEATFAGESKIRTISFQERIGKRPEDTCSGDITQTILIGNTIDDTEYFVYFCSYCNSPQTVQRLRDNAIEPTWTPEMLNN